MAAAAALLIQTSDAGKKSALMFQCCELSNALCSPIAPLLAVVLFCAAGVPTPPVSPLPCEPEPTLGYPDPVAAALLAELLAAADD